LASSLKKNFYFSTL